jgi:hypothetical protein
MYTQMRRRVNASWLSPVVVDGLGRPYKQCAVLAGGKLETRQQTMCVKKGLI